MTNNGSSILWIRGMLALILVSGLLVLTMETLMLNFHLNIQHVIPSNRLIHGHQLQQHRHQFTGFNATIILEDLLELQKASKDTANQFILPQDFYHLSLLNGACIKYKNAIVSWKFGAPGPNQDNEDQNLGTLISEDDANLLHKLKQCPDVDLFLPSEVRGYGYCEDSMAYTKYLKTRLLPLWALTKKMYDSELGREVDYFDLCPRTPMLFFQHYWNDIPSSPRWPWQKKMYLMPNIEMLELNDNHYWRADAVLCKTRICNESVNKWYEHQGDPNNGKVIYTKHTSSDLASYARHVLGDQVKPKNFSDVRFIHTVGGSYWKGTRQVIQCWLSRPHFPPLDLYIHKWRYESMFKGEYDESILKSQIRLTTDDVDPSTFSKVVAESAYFLCPSLQEGYGHYINQARASGGVIITTAMDPMKELIENDDTGLIVPARSLYPFFEGNLRNMPRIVAQFSGEDLCTTLEHLLNDLTIEQRKRMGENARLQYHKDTKFFEQAMIELRILARHHASGLSDNNDNIEIISSERRTNIRDRSSS